MLRTTDKNLIHYVELNINRRLGTCEAHGSQGRDLLDILDDRHDRKSTVATSQLPADLWHKMIGEPTRADAMLDRLVHNAYRITLKGESMRRIAAKAKPGDRT